jgi:hypothetical protein
MIEARVRELVADVQAASDDWSLAQRTEEIAGAEAAIAMLQAMLSVEAAAFEDQRKAADRAAGVSPAMAGRGASAEIAMARGVSRATVDYQLTFARQLVVDHPRLLDAYLDGQVSQSAAKHVVAACDVLDAEQCRAIDAELTQLACELTPGDVRKAALRKVAAADPQAAERRAKQARARKAVRAVMHGDGVGSLSALLPAEQTLACWQALDREARCRRGDGDERSIDQLMCDLLVERVTGQSKATGLNLEVGVVISNASLLGLDDQPAKLVGHQGGDYGVLPAEIARQLMTDGDAWFRRLVCDPINGRLISMDTGKRRFTGALRKFICYRDGTSRRPYSSAPIYDIDHIVRHVDGGPTSAGNGEGIGKYDHVLLDLPGWASEAIDGDAANGVRWTTPTGHVYDNHPPPILGYGNTKAPSPARRRPCPWWPSIELHPLPVAIDYAASHRRTDN